MITFYFDEHVHAVILAGLRRKGIDVVTVQEDSRTSADDGAVFSRATELKRVLVSSDSDMLAIANERMRREEVFGGLLYLTRATVSQHLESLECIAASATTEELANTVWFLPL